MKVVILLGGENKRFLEKDYQTHKALLKIDNEKTVLDYIVNCELKAFHEYIDKITDVKFVITNYNRVCYNHHKYYEYDDIKKLQIQKLYEKIHSFKTFFDSEDISFSIVDNSPLKAGALYSAYNAIIKDFKPNDNEPILIMNCDQFVKFIPKNINDLKLSYDDLKEKEYITGLLLHANKINVPKEYQNNFGYSELSYAYDRNSITKIIEKKSDGLNDLHTGHYFIKNSPVFMEYALKAFDRKETINGEYFISTIFQLMLEENKTVIHTDVETFVSIGIPELYEHYIIQKLKSQ